MIPAALASCQSVGTFQEIAHAASRRVRSDPVRAMLPADRICPVSLPSVSPRNAVQVSFALFADAANLSQEGKLNVLGVFDAVHVASLPAVHPRAHLVVRLKGGRADAGDHSLQLHWLAPDGTELWSSTGELHVEAALGGEEMDLPLIMAIDLPLTAGGRYTMQVSLDEEPKTELRLLVHGPPTTARGSPRGLVS